jgi:hypothetical protein
MLPLPRRPLFEKRRIGTPEVVRPN